MTVSAPGTMPASASAAILARGSNSPTASRSKALMPLGSHGGVVAVPHHEGGAWPAPMTDVPPTAPCRR